eukprot:1262545-Ditylum_brightwellii.AAC.1
MHQGCFDYNRDQGSDTDEAAVHLWKAAVIELEDISRCCDEEKSTVVTDPTVGSTKEGTRHGNPWHHMRIVIQSKSIESNHNNEMLWSQGENGLVRQIVVCVINILAGQDCDGNWTTVPKLMCSNEETGMAWLNANDNTPNRVKNELMFQPGVLAMMTNANATSELYVHRDIEETTKSAIDFGEGEMRTVSPMSRQPQQLDKSAIVNGATCCEKESCSRKETKC